MKLTVTTFVSLDGVMQSPGGPDEDRRGGFGLGGWAVPFDGPEVEAYLAAVFDRADAFLLGRETYVDWAAYWPSLGDRTPVSAALNARPKYVASTTLTETGWAGSTLLTGDAADAVPSLLARPGRELQVHGSGRLAQSLAARGLVDTYRLLVAPLLLGSGRRLFKPGASPAELRLTEHVTTATGLQLQTYERVGEVRHGTSWS